MSPLEPTSHVSFCRICNAACGILVTTRGDQVERVRGDPDHPISRGYTCPKGRALAAFHHDPRRLDHPTVRRNGTPQRVAWDEALDDLATRLGAILDEDGPSAVAGYLGTAIAFDAAGYRATGGFLAGLGTPQRYTCATVDTPCKPLVSELMSGFGGLHPIPDAAGTDLLLLIGSNPVVSHGHLTGLTSPVERLRAISRRGEVWVMDPRRTETARRATRHLQNRPGSDPWVLGYLVRELLCDGADTAYLSAHARASDVDALTRAVDPFDRTNAARHSDVTEQDLADLLAAIRSRGRLAAVTGTGSTMSAAANVNEWLVWALQVITGSFERPGGAWFNPGYVSRLHRIPRWTPGTGVAEPGPASRPDLPRRMDEYPCAGLVDEIESGHVRALFVPGGNPLAAFPEAPRLRAALARLEVLVVGDVVDNEIVELATHVWPCAGQLERADHAGIMEFYRQEVSGQLTRAVVPPEAERRPIWWCFAQLAKRLGFACLPGNLDPALCSDDEVVDSLAGAALAELVASPHGCVADRPEPWVTRNVLPEGRWCLAPEPLVQQLRGLREPPALALVPGRQLRSMNSALRDVSAVGERCDEARVHLHPEDARAAGVADGEAVRIYSAHGDAEGVAEVDDSLRPGAVWIPHGWLQPDLGALTSARHDIDPLTGMVLQSGVEVRVEPIDAPARSPVVRSEAP